jgi:hypothetical protein
MNKRFLNKITTYISTYIGKYRGKGKVNKMEGKGVHNICIYRGKEKEERE